METQPWREDLIRRGDVSEIVHDREGKVLRFFQEHDCGFTEEFWSGVKAALCYASNYVWQIPASDAMEIIRCIDCEHYREGKTVGQYIRKIRVRGILEDLINWCRENEDENGVELLEMAQEEIDKLEVVDGVKVILPPRNEEEMRCAEELYHRLEVKQDD